MDIAGSEVPIRVVAFVATFALLAVAESWAPRRCRAVTRGQRWPGNLGLVALDTVLVRVVPPASILAVAALGEARGWGVLHAVGSVPGWLSVLASVVALDFAIYLQHVLFHAVPAFWRVHRVHHTDPELDVTTGVRFHPVEMLLSVGFKAAAVAVLGPPVVAVALFEIVLNAGSLWSHANLRLPAAADRIVRAVLVTPDMHRVHHSAVPAETDSNFGFTLSWWDHLFGTYRGQPSAGHEGMRIGVEGFEGADILGLHRLLLQPLLKGPASPAFVPGQPDSGHTVGLRS
ncbi:MAG TPA: sterol desaturase family protein [Methylomirabilota bacterium]|jgi:sterol desaturase/sphingolipid hydroxylase (fatty acid hydroxylase superfamily)|nr:sterol desaturase family protein [Methylomirabilota bacterium]